MNEREKGLFDLMCGLGKAIMEEARKTNVTQDACHMIVFSPETGYVRVEVYCNGKVYTAYRFDQFPELKIEEREDKNKHFGSKKK